MICTEKPKDGVTKEQPFLSGTGGSENFRIPGIVTLNDGTVVEKLGIIHLQTIWVTMEM